MSFARPMNTVEGEPLPTPLRELWSNRAQRLATNVATRAREHREIAHAAALRLATDHHDATVRKGLLLGIHAANGGSLRSVAV